MFQSVELGYGVQDLAVAEIDRACGADSCVMTWNEAGVRKAGFAEFAIFGVDVIRQIVIISAIVSND
ncbi:hypothetical protein GC170_07145 [bacterium]|nr:hypothetical protein [bacterium]